MPATSDQSGGDGRSDLSASAKGKVMSNDDLQRQFEKQIEVLTVAQNNALTRAFKAESDLKSAREYAERFLKERNEARQSLRNLVAALKKTHESDSYQRVWQLAAIHGENYNGPYYTEELDSAEKLLKEMK